jgi:hypothetical protein
MDLYQTLNRFAEHKSAEKRYGAVRVEARLAKYADKYKFDPSSLQRLIDPAASHAENKQRVREYLQQQGMGVIGSWLRAGKATRISEMVTYRTQNQEDHLKQIATLTDGLLSNDAIYAGAMDDMLAGTHVAPASGVISSEKAKPTRALIENSFDEANNTLDPDLRYAYQGALRARGLANTSDPVIQRQCLDEVYNKQVSGSGFFNWLLKLLWGRQRDKILSSGALNTIMTP